jgi:galactose mutarotase-like enzyme
LDYEIIGRQLHVRAQIVNSGDKEMPVSFGFHPAFRWPLVSGVPKEAYAISFDQIEDLPIRRLVNGLLADAVVPSPVHDRWLGLREAIFTDDALIFDRLKSRHVTYGASSGPKVIVRFGGMPHLGIWSKPGADFICIEPWQGFASPADFHGEFKDKPGTVVINAGGAKYFEMQIQLPV